MSSQSRWKAVLELAARVILGGTFIYLGMLKAIDPIGFLKLVRQFNWSEAPWLLNFIAATLPWFEIFCGACLVLGAATRGAALLLLFLLFGFTTVIASRALEIYHQGALPFCGIRFDCGCGSGEVLICAKLVENLGLIVLAYAVLMARGRVTPSHADESC
ncbi:MAG: DoxX family protein [Verrucomicrobiota bacterium]